MKGAPEEVMGRKVDAAVLSEVRRDDARRRQAKRKRALDSRGAEYDDDDEARLFGDDDNDFDNKSDNNEVNNEDKNDFGNEIDAKDKFRNAEDEVSAVSGGLGYRDRAAERRSGKSAGGLVDAAHIASEYASVLGSGDGALGDLGHAKKGLDLEQVQRRREEIRLEHEANLKTAAGSGELATTSVSAVAQSVVKACLERNKTEQRIVIKKRHRSNLFQPGVLAYIYDGDGRIPRIKSKVPDTSSGVVDSAAPLTMMTLQGWHSSVTGPLQRALELIRAKHLRSAKALSKASLTKRSKTNFDSSNTGTELSSGQKDVSANQIDASIDKGGNNDDDDDDIFSDIEEDYQVNLNAVLAKREQFEEEAKAVAKQRDEEEVRLERERKQLALDEDDGSIQEDTSHLSSDLAHYEATSNTRGSESEDGQHFVGPSVQPHCYDTDSAYPEANTTGPSLPSNQIHYSSAYPEADNVGPSMPSGQGDYGSVYPEADSIGPSMPPGHGDYSSAYPEVDTIGPNMPPGHGDYSSAYPEANTIGPSMPPGHGIDGLETYPEADSVGPSLP
mmetsp:Transcript_6045/g.12315  ORF Transcript_6045/g.12315 Transcript_6045/m.12315 type:complete len:558 (-) Transcript_6045:467-2140(-)